MIHEVLPKAVSNLTEQWSTASPVPNIAQLQLTDSRQLHELRFLTECLLAARDIKSLCPPTTRALQRLFSAIRTRFEPHPHRDVLAWWVVSTWIGYSLLVTSDCRVPSTLPDAISTMLRSSIHLIPDSDNHSATQHALPTPMSSTETSNNAPLDSLGHGVLHAARQRILREGLDATDVRSIAREQGVTTGAIYRRFAGKSEILEKVLERELPFNRRTWVPLFIAALAEGGAEAAAEVLTLATEPVWTDRATAHLLLEFTVAAHSDENILRKLHESITQSAHERERLFVALINEQLVRPDLAPELAAWMLQVPPIGMRILGALDIVPETRSLSALIAGYLRYLSSADT